MSGLKRLIHRTWSTTPAMFSTRLFPPENNLLVPPRRFSYTRFLHVFQGSSDEVKENNFDDISELRRLSSKPLCSCNGWRSTHSSSSPSMMRSTIWSSKVAQFCTSTTDNTTVSDPEKSNSETKKGGNGGVVREEEDDTISFTEAKRLMRLVNVEALKLKLGMEGKEVIGYTELLEVCESMGVARTVNEATAFARVLDEAGVILLFRDKVYLHPDKVVDLVRKAVPLALTSENDPRRGELKALEERKEEIDVLAQNQVRRILWSGLGLAILQVGLFFRLTFWEFSWDVMEPIAFFTTTTGIVIGYAYFLFTRRDPTYQDLMKRLFLSRQRKLFKTKKFDVERLLELQKKCKSPLDLGPSLKNQARVDVEALNNR